LRAIRRSGISVHYSEGYHPKPKISFNDPLPLGTESNREFFILTVNRPEKPEKIVGSLNRQLPNGIRILDCSVVLSQKQTELKDENCFEVILKQGCYNEVKIKEFLASKTFFLELRNRKGKLKKIDLKYMIKELQLPDPNRLKLTIRKDVGKTVRPFDVLTRIFDLPEKEVRQASIVKTN